MPDKSYELHGVRIFECAIEGSRIRDDLSAIDLIALAWEHRAEMVVLPVERLDDEFFDLSTRIAGAIIQKFVNYRLSLAILGDISQHARESSALRDFVFEANRGDHVWFVASSAELAERLGTRSKKRL